MNFTGNGTFKEGNTFAKAKGGKQHQETIVKEALSKDINNIKDRLLEITWELLNSDSLKIKAFAWKELIKFIIINPSTAEGGEQQRIIITVVKNRNEMENNELENL